jgi:hypothetical protein
MNTAGAGAGAGTAADAAAWAEGHSSYSCNVLMFEEEALAAEESHFRSSSSYNLLFV